MDLDYTRIYLCRHGATPGNERIPRILQGSAIDDSLSELGLRQAEALAEFLAPRHIDAVYSSALTRARQTAEAIGAKHGLEPVSLDQLNEVDAGRWVGLTWEEVESTDAEALRLFQESTDDAAYPGGESFSEVLGRTLPVLESLAVQHQGQSLVIVGHSVVNRVLLAHWLGMALGTARLLIQNNTCINLLQRYNGVFQVLSVNAYFHLWDAPDLK